MILQSNKNYKQKSNKITENSEGKAALSLQ